MSKRERRRQREQIARMEHDAQLRRAITGTVESAQPRFAEQSVAQLFGGVISWAASSLLREPSERASRREWDAFYRSIARQEPFLASVLAGAVMIDANREWTLTGVRSQVVRYRHILQQVRAESTAVGMRPFVEWLASSYYTTQMGWVAEVGSEGEGGPLAQLWAVDPCRCELLGGAAGELAYYSIAGGKQTWLYGRDYLRACSQTSTDERLLGYGWPAVARCYELAKIMLGVYHHYLARLGAATPDAILSHNAMTDEQWQQVLQARETILRDNSSYLNSIIAVGNPGGDPPRFELTTLSSLPDRFDIEQWTLVLLRGYQAAFGYGAGEFYPESYGVIGRGKEQEQQHRSSTGKGGKDFSLKFTEQLNSRLPRTVSFAFDERDVAGEQEDAELRRVKAAAIAEMAGWAVKVGGVETSVLTREQILQLAARDGVIPPEWTPEDETVTVSSEDTDIAERIQRVAPDEPVVRYYSRTDSLRVLCLARRCSIGVSGLAGKQILPEVRRSTNGYVRSYRDQLLRAVYDAYRTHDAVSLRRAHRVLVRSVADMVFREGLREGGADPDEMDDDDRRIVNEWVTEQLAHVNDFASDVIAAHTDTERIRILARIEMWADAVRTLGGKGELSAKGNAMYTFTGQDGADSCMDCQRLKGQRHRAKWWLVHNLVPHAGNSNFECGGWQCQHYLVSDDGRSLEV